MVWGRFEPTISRVAGFLAAFSASELLTSLLAIFEELILLAALRADSGALRACANPYFVNNYHRNHIPMPNLVISKFSSSPDLWDPNCPSLSKRYPTCCSIWVPGVVGLLGRVVADPCSSAAMVPSYTNGAKSKVVSLLQRVLSFSIIHAMCMALNTKD